MRCENKKSCQKCFSLEYEWIGSRCYCEPELKVGTQLIHKENKFLSRITQIINTTCGQVFYKTTLGGDVVKTAQQIRKEYYIVAE